MTAYSLSKDIAKCFAAGMDDFLSKPFTLEDFRGMLARWLIPGSTTVSD